MNRLFGLNLRIMNSYVRRFQQMTIQAKFLHKNATIKSDMLTKELLLSAKGDKSENRFQNAVRNLEEFDAGWFQNLKEHRLVSSVANDLVKNKRYEDFDLLISKMNIDRCSLGLKTTSLKCYVERQLWDEAINLFEEVEEKVKHLRLYHDIIQGFSKHQNIDIAHGYLKKLSQKEKENSFKRNTNMSQNTIGSLLKAVAESVTPHHRFEIVETILKYMQQGDYPANDLAMSSLQSILNSTNSTACYSEIDDSCRCRYCNTKLLLEKDFTEVHKEICENIESQLFKTGSHSHLQKIKQSFADGHCYDYIVDVANVLCSQARNNQVNLKRLKNVLDCIIDQMSYSSRIALVLPRGGVVKSIDLSRYIRHLCQSFVMSCHIDIVGSRKLEDDLLVLYMTSKSALLAGKDAGKINIVSNDYYTEYTSLVSEQHKGNMLSWLRDSVKGFTNDGGVCGKAYMPVVLMHGNRIHVRSEHDRILCVTHK